MSTNGADHTLIKNILILLELLEKNHIDIDHLTESEWPDDISLSSDPHSIRSAYEVINFMNEMPGGFFIYRADGDEEIIYANQALLRIFKCETRKDFEELTGNSFKGIVHPDDLEEVEKSILEQIANSKYDLDYVEYRIIRKDGSIRWAEDYGHFVRCGSIGDIFYVFLGDATEKKERQLSERAVLINAHEKKEEQLQILIEEYDKEKKLINQEHLRRLEVIEGLSVNYESILYADLDTNKILPYRLSSRTERQFEKKYQLCDFTWYVSDYVNTWVHPEDRESVANVTDPEYIRAKLSECKTYYINYRAVYHEEVQYLQLRIVNVGTNDHVSQIVMGYQRIDSEIQTEIEQKEILKEALNTANLAITAKNTFLSNMSHDIRTPLNAIFGYTSLAKKHIASHDTTTVADYLDKIETASNQLLDLIDKVLEISWTESDDIHIEENECHLPSILEEVQAVLLPQASEKNISISLDTNKLRHPNVYSDRDKLKQILLYVADNAITYTKNDGTVTLAVSELEKLPNNYVVCQFEIKDTGIGIKKEFLSHIFEPFEREKNTTFSGIYGTGLGLTIAKNIVEMMGGDINAKSTVGKGSTFTFTLRFRIQNHSLSSPESTEDPAALLGEKKILLVEDNEINLEIETEIFHELGFHVDTATDGAIAVDKIEHSTPGEYALILMDIQMPVMNGWDATKKIRQLENPELSHIPIIALSANALENDKRISIECGMNAHLTKPLNVPQLLENIEKAMQIYKEHKT
ncbi:MAG: ATP-binding protein [Roseburia sp.]|nr:ATP-binding protein [Roseburia sp.]